MDIEIENIKRFNRFYLNVVGLYTQYTDGSPYSMSDAMILYEIKKSDKCTASELCEFFEFDKGYISRIINNLSNQGLIKRVSSTNDKRKKYLHITIQGENVLKELSNKASDNVRRMIEKVTDDELDSLIKSMEEIERILSLKKGGNKNV